MKYDHSSQHRAELAKELVHMLVQSGFAKVEEGYGEDVYRYQCIGGTEIFVYTTIVNGSVRAEGQDAIRVSAVYRRKDGEIRGLWKDKRVNRTGDIPGIVERTKSRMRECYVNLRDRHRPHYMCKHCGAPLLFLAKSGRMVCAEACWIKN